MVTSYLLRSNLVQKPYQYFHYYFLLEKQPGCVLSDLNFDTDIKVSIQKFKNHDWTWREMLHYGYLSSVIFFVFVIFPAPILLKIPVLSLFCIFFLIPLTSQFFVHALPILAWLALFFSTGKIPSSWKPPISVKSLPAMETVLYGDNLSNVLATFNNVFLDIMAWIPYGILHFSAPFVVALFIFLFGPPTSLRSFGFAFGYMNLTGLMIQILFPAAPPWYKNLHGLEPADYSMYGSPGGLGRIDAFLGFDMYTSAFSNSPVVFGAFPSLHSGCAVMDVLFLCWLFPRYRFVWWGWATWLWWSTMYLTHHYFIDLIGGAVLSVSVFIYTKYVHLPVRDPTKFCRWSYTEVEKINIHYLDPLSYDGEARLLTREDATNSFLAPRGNYPYMQSNFNNTFQMSAISRSRQSSRAAVPLSPQNNASVGHSSSSVNLVPQAEESMGPTEEVDTSLLENSSPPSVFDGDADERNHMVSSTASSTSLDDFDNGTTTSGASSHYKNTKSQVPFNR